jgi:hypothetical protein
MEISIRHRRYPILRARALEAKPQLAKAQGPPLVQARGVRVASMPASMMT